MSCSNANGILIYEILLQTGDFILYDALEATSRMYSDEEEDDSASGGESDYGSEQEGVLLGEGFVVGTWASDLAIATGHSHRAVLDGHVPL